MQRRSGTGFMDGYLALPGGHVQEAELIDVAAIRECREEVCIDVLTAIPKCVMPFEGGIDFIFEAKEWVGVPEIGEPDRCSEVGWFNSTQLPAKTAPFVLKAIELRNHDIWYHQFED